MFWWDVREQAQRDQKITIEFWVATAQSTWTFYPRYKRWSLRIFWDVFWRKITISIQTSETIVKLISGSQDSLIQMVSKYTMSLLISIRLIAPSIQNVRKRIRAWVDEKTCRSMKNCHNTLNIIPCNPFAIHFVTNPLPNNPNQPSTAITALAASIYPMRVSFTWR